MIPKIIHYCWFGRNPLPKLAQKCIKSWKKHCPDYEIIQWNEDNFDISACPLYVRQAYEAKKWAFVTDYVRLKVVCDHGGIYLDTDVELKKSPDALLSYSAYFGFEDSGHVATGLGFGAEKKHPLLKELMEDYAEIPFVREDGSFDTLPCPQRNTAILLKHGLLQNNTRQVLEGGILILPCEYLCPLSYQNGLKKRTKNTISIHWFDASWQSAAQKKAHRDAAKKRNREARRDYVRHTPNRLMRALLGTARYDKLKSTLKRGG